MEASITQQFMNLSKLLPQQIQESTSNLLGSIANQYLQPIVIQQPFVQAAPTSIPATFEQVEHDQP